MVAGMGLAETRLDITQGLAGPKNWSLTILLGSNVPHKAFCLESHLPSSSLPGTFIYCSACPTISLRNYKRGQQQQQPDKAVSEIKPSNIPCSQCPGMPAGSISGVPFCPST